MAEVEGIAGWVKEQWKKADAHLAQQRRDYWLNLAFYQGEQWVQWQSRTSTVIPWTRLHDSGRVQYTANRIQSNLTNLMSKLTKRWLGFEVPPSASDDADIIGAKLAEHILEASRVDCGWEGIRVEEIHDAFLGGCSAVLVEWDATAGDTLGIDDETGKVINEGQVQLSSLALPEFTLEPGSRSQREARWCIVARAYPPEQVQARWKLDSRPPTDTTTAAGPIQRDLWRTRGYSNIDLTTVYSYYQRPGPKATKGRWVVVVGQDAVIDEPWPFPFRDRLNLYVFRQLQVSKQWYGGTFLNDARPIQVAYNLARSNLSEHMKHAGNSRLAVPDDSDVDPEDLTDRPGEIIRYNGQGQKPSYIDPPNLPRWLREEAVQLGQELDDIMSVHAISRGEAPGDRNSGLALSLLAEKDETPLGLMARDQSEGWGSIASMVLKLWEAKVHEQRSATINVDIGSGVAVPITRKWTGKQLRGQTQATVPLDSTLPHSRVALQSWVTQLAQTFPTIAQQVNLPMLARLLDIPSQAVLGEMADADVAQAMAENHLMLVGEIPAAGGKPFPMDFDDHAKHIAEHNRARKSAAYRNGTPKARQIMDMHVLAHENLERDAAAGQLEQNRILPGAAAFPQAHEPFGSRVPPDYAERQQAPALGAPA